MTTDVDDAAVVAFLLATSIPASEWRAVLDEPFACERRLLADPTFEHNHDVVYVAAGQLPKLGSKRRPFKPTESRIGQVYFLWHNVDHGKWDDAFWLCIGKTNDSPFFFSYFSDRCGTGFGFAETSTLFLAKSLSDILSCTLTDRQRRLVRQSHEEKMIHEPPIDRFNPRLYK